MAKAINWPAAYRNEILGEDTDTLRCAVRLGTLYYDNRFWADGEVVDIRVNHLKVRKGIVHGDLKACPIQDLTPAELAALKSDLKTPEALATFLATTYNQPVDLQTVVTLVFYRNLPVVPEEIETPEDARPETEAPA
jgi:hypothetical protein